MKCEVCASHGVERPAEWNVRTQRGENVDVCTAHKDELIAALIGRPVVTRIEP